MISRFCVTKVLKVLIIANGRTEDGNKGDLGMTGPFNDDSY